MSQLILIRHGETADGEDDADPGLSDLGRRQVTALADRLRTQTISALWHGPRRRTALTAELLRDALPAVTAEPTAILDDRTPVPSSERRPEYSQDQLAWLAEVPADERDVDGAELDHAWQQLTTFARDRGPLLAVTHAFVIAWFVRSALDAPPSRWMGLNCENASLTVVEVRPSGTYLRSFNDSGHLLWVPSPAGGPTPKPAL